jgi:hypothetical protein
MTTVFTLCSANYLAHAKSLGESLREHNPDYKFVIGLVDRLPRDQAQSICQPYKLIPVEDLGIPAFADMVKKYDIIEFNTAVKPFYIEHLFQLDSSVEGVIYLDPDILVCSSLGPIEEKLKNHPILLTPHSCTYDHSPLNIYYERAMLTTGVYNLGFVATSRSEVAFAFLHWWQKRLQDYCFDECGRGLFVDQLWVILALVYFPGVFVEKDPGYNMCYWNHFERRLSVQNGRYFVNERFPLVFYHFSSYDPKNPTAVTKRVGQMTQNFEERPDLRAIYEDYRRRLLANGYDEVRNIPYAFRSAPPLDAHRGELKFKVFFKGALRGGLRALPRPFGKRLKRLADFTSRSFQ